MARYRPFVQTLTVLACCLSPLSTRANLEPASLFDARSVGMGGTGAAFSTGAGAAYHNPALLSGVDGTDLVLSVNTLFSQGRAPWPDPVSGNVSSLSSERTIAPVGYLGVAHKLQERVTAGLVAFVVGGSGAQFKNLAVFGGRDAQIGGYALELQVPVSVQLTERLSVGVGYRVTIGQAKINLPVLNNPQDPSAGFSEPETKFSGTHLTGIQLGVAYEPIDNLHLGLSYRSKVDVDLEGTTTLAGATLAENIPANLTLPHRIQAGAAYDVGDLTLAVDLKYFFYREAYPASVERAADWDNAYYLGLGGELAVGCVALRGGYTLGKMAASNGAVTQFDIPAGISHTLAVGAGSELASFRLDLALSYTFISDHTISEAPLPGDYGFQSPAVAFSIGRSF